MTRCLPLLALIMLGTAAPAHQITAGDLEIVHPHIPQPFAGARAAAGYMAIVNHGSRPDRLTGASAGFAARTSLHESRTGADGIATMRPVAALEIPAGGTLSLEPGGFHLMFLGLGATLTEGDMLPGTLTFERAGTVAVDFVVDPPGAPGHDPAGHDGNGGAPATAGTVSGDADGG
jgi:hypothetical protein